MLYDIDVPELPRVVHVCPPFVDVSQLTIVPEIFVRFSVPLLLPAQTAGSEDRSASGPCITVTVTVVVEVHPVAFEPVTV